MGRREYVSDGLRLDGRRPKELRNMRAQIGVLQSADGSAMFQMGNTQVLASVFGPREVEQRSQLQHDRAIVKCEYAMAAFSTGERRRRGKTDRRSTELSLVIRNTLEQTIQLEEYARSQIDVYVQVLQADGGTRCACINAAMLALADAGIKLRDVIASCAAGYLQGTPLLDLNHEEDRAGGPDISVAYQPGLGKIVALQMDGRLPTEAFDECVQLAIEGCKAMAGVMRKELLRHTRALMAAGEDAGGGGGGGGGAALR
ncbi:exosome complex component [Raphidocelis subcapitata]|uniref:Exosome complex component n=1 Tax=Raphidocelis subcapitata TaxID=307507 RepID=A0A2V0P8Z7_9CHLO|nr:exosome complex component [Raphidocelis subcapitata]|eukprot:GBF94363.1 exosome complex component [Raphidocelis subcapitata]